MIDSSDKQTGDLLGQKRRGRPVTGQALTGAQRVAKHRAAVRLRGDLADLLIDFSVFSDSDLLALVKTDMLCPQMSSNVFALCLRELTARRASRV